MILSAVFGNLENSSVVVQTNELGAIAIQLPPLPDVSDGWQAKYLAWVEAGGVTAPFTEAHPVETVEAYAASQGYRAFDMTNLLDLSLKLVAAGIPLPAKASAVRAWVDDVRLAFAIGQEPPSAPYTYDEVQAEVLNILLNQ